MHYYIPSITCNKQASLHKDSICLKGTNESHGIQGRSKLPSLWKIQELPWREVPSLCLLPWLSSQQALVLNSKFLRRIQLSQPVFPLDSDIIGVPQEEKDKGPEKISEEITVENFPNMAHVSNSL